MLSPEEDWLLRQAAFAFVEAEARNNGGAVHVNSLMRGFEFNGEVVALMNYQRGIWKPRQLSLPISIQTSLKNPYNDDPGIDGLLHYRYQGDDPQHRDNVGLRRLMGAGLPLIYFRAVVAGWYTPLWPLVIVGDNPSTLTFELACEDVESLVPGVLPDIADAARRKYVTRLAVVRLHQDGFRRRVLSAYREKCAICRIAHKELLDAAHIIPDKQEGGDPVVPNGLSMCKIHHAAYDANILGIRPDYRVEIQTRILHEVDGPMLKHGLQELNGVSITVPSKSAEKPDPERLEVRFREFLAAG